MGKEEGVNIILMILNHCSAWGVWVRVIEALASTLSRKAGFEVIIFFL